MNFTTENHVFLNLCLQQLNSKNLAKQTYFTWSNHLYVIFFLFHFFILIWSLQSAVTVLFAFAKQYLKTGITSQQIKRMHNPVTSLILYFSQRKYVVEYLSLNILWILPAVWKMTPLSTGFAWITEEFRLICSSVYSVWYFFLCFG